jgi:hypothetical protein
MSWRPEVFYEPNRMHFSEITDDAWDYALNIVGEG